MGRRIFSDTSAPNYFNLETYFNEISVQTVADGTKSVLPVVQLDAEGNAVKSASTVKRGGQEYSLVDNQDIVQAIKSLVVQQKITNLHLAKMSGDTWTEIDI